MLAVLASPYVLGLILATAATLSLGVAAFLHRDEPASLPFSALCVLLAAWAATTCLGLLVSTESTRLLLERLHWVYAAIVPVLWLSFALQYSGYGDALTRRRMLLLSLPTVAFVLVLFADPGDLVWSSYEFVETDGLYLVDQNLGPLTVVLSIYLFTVTLAGAAVVVRFGLTAGHLYRDQTLSLVVAVTTPIVVSLFSMVDATPLQGLNVTPYALSVSAIAFGNAMYRYDFLENAPSTRRFGQHVVTKSMRDGVLVVDDRDRIVECNPVAARVLGVTTQEALGSALSDVVDENRVVDGHFDQNTHLRAAAGNRRYAIERSPVVDQHDHQVGRVYVLRDVTEAERREERLAVLNRVLRHNLRNDMNVVDGHATELADRLDGEEAEMAASVADVAADLVELSYKARTVETVMAEDDPEPSMLDDLVTATVASLTDQHPEASFQVDVPTVSVARGDVVAAVVANVVENAVEHAGPSPTVTVRGTVYDTVVELAVVDDGPGIPDGELRALRDGEESPLEHGSGLGLWIISWGIERLGGDLDVETGADGTTMTLGFPIAGAASDPDADADGDRWIDDDAML